MKDQIKFAAIGAVLILAMVATVQADCCAACPSWHGGFGYAPSYVYVRDYIPYFALHPPVYYSLPVPRTYGYSPFAYPPGTMTPEIPDPEPVVVPNKYVPSKAAPKAEPGRVTAKPLRISNPYVLVRDESRPAEGIASR